MARQPLPGNEDLAHLIPPDPPGTAWEAPAMAVLSVTMVSAGLFIASRFALMYHELGLQLPRQAELVLGVWFHGSALVALAVPCIWRFRVGPSSWAVRVWFLITLLYFGYLALGLFSPLMNITINLGEQAR